MTILSSDGARSRFPLSPSSSDDQFAADQPLCGPRLNITEVLVYLDALKEPVTFALEAFTLSEEEGLWTLTMNHRDDGLPDLEYYAKTQHGKPVRDPVVYQWDHHKQEMVAN
jgi:hypothetical protein